MRHLVWLGLLILTLTGCTNRYMAEQCRAGNAELIGQRDALSGRAARTAQDLETLCQRHTAPISFTEYQKGFNQALTGICRNDELFRWGARGLAYPQGCNSLHGAQEYQQAWQGGWDWWVSQIDWQPFWG